MKKKLLALTMSAIMALAVLAGCGGSKPDAGKEAGGDATTEAAPEAEASEAPAEESAKEPAAESSEEAPAAANNGKFALALSHTTNAFTTTFAENAQAKAKELGVELTVFDGNKDSATQISQIESAITQGYAGIMVEPVSVDGIKPAVQAANKAGIPVITVIQKMTEQDLVKTYVGGNDKGAAILEMTKAIEGIGGKGNIAILYGPMGSDAQLIRKEGYDEVLAQHPDVKIVFDQSAGWVTDEALKITENWLQSGTEINAIVSQNDGMAVGAMKAVEDAKLNDSIKIYGIDATPDGTSAIAAGRMEGTVSQNVAGMGQLGMETLNKIANGETVDPEVLTEAQWIDKTNVEEFLK